MINLSADQKQALLAILEWYKKDKQAMPYITLGGYAGTGKTTLIAVLRKKLAEQNKKLKVAFVSYTGKASRVLQNKLQEERISTAKDSVGTIHSLIYSPIVNDQQEITGWQPKEKISKDLIIIDEASMVDKTIWQHLLDYRIPIIAVGDHGQLPPISGFFNLMQKPDLVLEQIHRQARENPIINLSIQARETGSIKVANYGDRVKKYSMQNIDGNEVLESLLNAYNQDTLVLCGYNHTRKKLNNFIRQALGFEVIEPTVNDRVICLRNNHAKNIFNGMLGTIAKISKKNPEWYDAEILMDKEEQPYKGLISVQQFNSNSALNFTDKRSRIVQGDLFDFGYALTVHKAQGSQAKKVILLEERFKQMDDEQWRRWLYTAVTRAEEELYIFG